MQATNSSQAGRLIPRASPQASQEYSTLILSTISQAGNPQALLADSTLSPAEILLSQAGSSQPSQAGSSQSSLGENTLHQSNISQAGSPQASPVDNALSLAESELSQAGSSQSFPEDSALSQSNISQAGSSQASPVDNTPSLAESEISQAASTWSSQAGSSQSSLEDSTLQAESTLLPQKVRHSARLRASQAQHIPQAGNSSRQAGTTPRVDSMVSQPDNAVPQVASPQANAYQEARSFPNRHNTPQGSSPLEEPNPK